MRALSKLPLMMGLSLCVAPACSSAPERVAYGEESAEAAALDRAEARLREVRSDVARLVARRDGLREVIRARDPLGDFVALRCTEAGLGHAMIFATRAERAHQGLRAAIIEGDSRAVDHRLKMLELAAVGVADRLREVRGCGALPLSEFGPDARDPKNGPGATIWDTRAGEGETPVIKSTLSAILEREGEPTSLAGTGAANVIRQLRIENEALRQEVEALRELSYHDPLTGLNNRRYFDERLTEEFGRAQRHGEQTLSVLVMDVDDFKSVNDRFGHVIGDEVLTWVARFLERSVREHDIVCRTGGDEFMVVLPAADAEGCQHLVERIATGLFECRGRRGEYGVSLSYGVATWTPGMASAKALVEAADARMYAQKFEKKERRSGPGWAFLSSA